MHLSAILPEIVDDAAVVISPLAMLSRVFLMLIILAGLAYTPSSSGEKSEMTNVLTYLFILSLTDVTSEPIERILTKYLDMVLICCGVSDLL